MTFYTNNKDFGGYFEAYLSHQLGSCKSGVIATGYISSKTVNNYKPSILKVVKKGGCFDLIVGMAFYEGLKKVQHKTLLSLHENIRSINPEGGGVKLVYVQKFHGKIYNLIHSKQKCVYLGSSNFSETGLRDNLEGTIEIKNSKTKKKVTEFLEWLNDKEQSVYIDEIDGLKITDSNEYKKGDIVKPKIESNEAGTYDISTIDISQKSYLDILLNRKLHTRQKSSFNTYFGKGRLARSTGKVTPRNWFEGEIVVDQRTTRHPLYPKGEFKVITDDGFTFECTNLSKKKNSSNHYKNIRSKGDLHTLGKWLKLKLQKSGALEPLTLVTAETFEKYGQDNLRLYKISKGVYFMEFKPKT